MQIVLSLSLLARMMDPSLNVAQRNNACFELRGSTDPQVVATMRKALNDTAVRACAGTNLRKAGAIDELKDALGDANFEVRALAARELGGFEKPDLLPLLLAFAAIYLVWGSTFLAIRFAVQTLPPLLMMGTRHLVAGALLFAWLLARKEPLPEPRLWRPAIFSGAFCFLGLSAA